MKGEKLTFYTGSARQAYAVLALAKLIERVPGDAKTKIQIEWQAAASNNGATVEFRMLNQEAAIDSEYNIAILLMRKYLEDLLQDEKGLEELNGSIKILNESSEFRPVNAALRQLNRFLTFRTYFEGGIRPGYVDIVAWSALKNCAIFNRQLKSQTLPYVNLTRWFSFINATYSLLAETTEEMQAQQRRLRTKAGDQGSFEIGLVGAEPGKVVTRFPPEPSGYLHIGHAKAALLNEYFAHLYEGKLIVRFDDTNPSKEKSEFEDSILEDLRLLGIKPNQISHTSDYFGPLLEYAWRLIDLGLAYVDDTDQNTMRQQRMKGIASRCRDFSVQENRERFDGMCNATEHGLKCCLRAKMSIGDPNKALRDPVIYRCNNQVSHHRTQRRYNVYPTYDFACPIVDSLEGVTHALRTNEYRDRNAQYTWFLNSLGLRQVHVWDFSRINFVYTLLSKRKLQWFVDQGLVSGWDDPRFPTVRGMRRRGLTVEALRQFILSQGASQNSLLMDWDKVWALNKKVIDKVAPRFVVVEKGVAVELVGDGAPTVPFSRELPRHKKNPGLGNKVTWFSNRIYLAKEDLELLNKGEEVTLMDWGNAIVEQLDIPNNCVLRLFLGGDVKKTKWKLTWLTASNDDELSVRVVLLDYDFLVSKRKLDEDDRVEDFLTPTTEFRQLALADRNILQLDKGDIVQFERRGFYTYDGMGDDQLRRFIRVPDGKKATIGLKMASGDNC